jgi:hypothetical protein
VVPLPAVRYEDQITFVHNDKISDTGDVVREIALDRIYIYPRMQCKTTNSNSGKIEITNGNSGQAAVVTKLENGNQTVGYCMNV